MAISKSVNPKVYRRSQLNCSAFSFGYSMLFASNSIVLTKHVSFTLYSDEKLILTPPKIMGLEESIEFIADDELIEVTPKNIRLRKTILDTPTRKKAQAKLKQG